MSDLLTYCKPGSFATTAQTFFDLGLPGAGPSMRKYQVLKHCRVRLHEKRFRYLKFGLLSILRRSGDTFNM